MAAVLYKSVLLLLLASSTISATTSATDELNLPVVPNASLVKQYACHEGFVGVGSGKLIGDKWSDGIEFKCLKTCRPLPEESNVFRWNLLSQPANTTVPYIAGSRYELECAGNYAPHERKFRNSPAECLPSGLWTYEAQIISYFSEDQIKAVYSCGPNWSSTRPCSWTPKIPHSDPFEGSSKLGEVEYNKYLCHDGYTPGGFDLKIPFFTNPLLPKNFWLVCDHATQKWSPPGAKCVPVQCPYLFKDVHGNWAFVSGSAGTEMGSLVYQTRYRLECQPGYRYKNNPSVGEVEVECSADGQWHDTTNINGTPFLPSDLNCFLPTS